MNKFIRAAENDNSTPVGAWQTVARFNFEDCMKWITNYRSYAHPTQNQRKAALKRIVTLRESLDYLENALKQDGLE